MEIAILVKKIIQKLIKPMVRKIYRYFISWYGYFKNYKAYKDRDHSQTVYLVGTPDHSNLGDHAIAEATMEFLKNEVGNYQITEITLDMYIRHFRCIKRFINKKDIILLNGGGSMGVEWFFFEELIRLFIKKLPDNKIIIMPQTVYYGDSRHGKRQFEKSREIYSSHCDLHIFAREKYSYEIMKKAYFKNKVYLLPDTVLYLDRSLPRYERNGILLCFRRDVEKNLTDVQGKEIVQYCSKYTDSISYTDTVTSSRKLYTYQRAKELEKKFTEFKRAQLVITDRLHGMIFCAITGTPCIALNNYNYKVKGVYEWLRNLDYVRFLEDHRDINKNIPELISMRNCYYNNKINKARFSVISELLNGEKVVV